MNIKTLALCFIILLSLSTSQGIIDVSQSVLSGTALTSFDSDTTVNILLQSRDSSGVALTTGGSIFMVDIRDYCISNANNNFICDRLTDTTDSHYNANIFPSPSNYIQDILTDGNDGQYTYSFSLIAKGWITIRVFGLTKGGLRGEYFDNVLFQNAPSSTQIDETINFNWGTSPIVGGALSNHVGVRWKGALLCPGTETYTFTVSTDDGIKIYIKNELVLDHLDSVCNDCTFTYSMTDGKYYDIEILYVQNEGEARAKIYWENTGLPKQIIPKDNLFYYEIVPNSPYDVEVKSEKGYAPNCEATGDGLSKAYVGIDATFTIQSKDVVNNAIAYNGDVYTVTLTGPGATTTGDVTGTVTYDTVANSGIYNAKYSPTKPGEYKLSIKLGSTEIKDSPFNVIVHIGEPSAIKSKIVGISSPTQGTAGITTTFNIDLYDALENKYDSDPEDDPYITVLAEFQDSNDYISPLGVSDLPNWESIIGKNFAGVVTSLGNGSYKVDLNVLKAGTFNIVIKIKNIAITGSPVVLKIAPSILDACKCVYVTAPPSTIECGNPITIQYQCRDMYSNNIIDKTLTDYPNYVVKIVNNDNTYSETGTIIDIPTKQGCFEVSFTPEKATTYSTYITINDVLIPQITFQANPSSTADYTKCQAVITNIKPQYIAGDSVNIAITSYDRFNNLIIADTTTAYTIEVIDSTPTSNTYPAVSKGNGIFSYDALLTKVDTYTIKVLLGSDTIATFNSIIVVANIATDTSVISDFSATSIAGVVNVFKATLKDKYSNTVFIQGNERISLDIKQSPFTIDTRSTEIIGEYNLGTYLFNDVTLTKAGSYSVVLKIINNFGLKGEYYRNVDFHNKYGLIDLKYHNLNVFYTRIDSTINFDLGYNAFFSGFQTAMISVVWSGFIKPVTTATYTISVVVEGRANVYIDSHLAISYTSIDTERTSTDTSDYVNSRLSADEYTPIRVEYIKGENALITKIKLMWESDTINKQVISNDVLYTDLYNDVKTMTITAGDINPSLFKITDADYNKCVTGITNTFNFEMYDSYNNLQTQSETYSILFTNKEDSTITYPGTVTSTGLGTSKVDYLIAKAGKYSMSIVITSNGLTTTLNDFNEFKCTSSTVDPSKTVIAGSGLTTAIAGEKASFTIALYDANSNVIDNTDSDINININVNIVSTNENVSTKVLSYDSSIKKYVVTYIAYNTLTPFTITITVNNDSTNAKTSTMTLLPNVPSNPKSSYSSSIVASYTMDTVSTLNVFIRDEYSNPTTDTFSLFTMIRGDFGIAKATYTKDTSDLSKYVGSFNIKRVNSTYSGCGTASLSTYVLISGIKRKIYDNYWMNGNKIKTIIDNEINFEYNENEDIVEGYDKMYSSMSFSFYIKAGYSEEYTFIITTNNNVRMFIDDTMVVDSFDKAMTSQYTYKISMNSGEIYSIRLNVYIAETTSKIKLEILSPSTPISTISTLNAFYTESEMPVESKEYIISTVAVPSSLSSLTEDNTAYSQNSITFKWKAPTDFGCSPITGYTIKKYDSTTSSYSTLTTVADTVLTYTDSASITVNTEHKYLVVVVNAIGDSGDSNIITCKSLSLSTAPQSLVVSYGNDNTAVLTWAQPTDTGAGDGTTIPIDSYILEVKDNIDTTYKEIFEGNLLTYTLNNVIYGRTYTFRVLAVTQRGKSPYSAEETKLCSSIPGKPLSPPTIIKASTTKTQVAFEYIPVTTTNGSPITKYMIYIDDDITFPSPTSIDNALNTQYTYTTSIVAGTKYYVKYSAVNANGEGPQSAPSLAMIAAEIPSAPQNIAKVVDSTVLVNTIKVQWETPSDDGGTSIIGYNLYLNDKLVDKVDNNILTYTFTDIKSISTIQNIKITAYNVIGEGSEASLLNQYATTVPAKVAAIRLLSSSTTSIQIEWDAPFDNGGSVIVSYDVRRDNGGNVYEAPVNVPSAMNYLFSGLSNTVGYYNFQVRANNINGNGPWSNYKSFYAASKPTIVQNLVISKQSTTEIIFKWDPPTDNGGCSIYNYKIYYHDENSLDNTLLSTLLSTSLEFTFNSLYHIQPSLYYTFTIIAVNCAYESDKAEISAYSASVPDKVPLLKVKEYSSTTSIKLEWSGSFYNGGMPLIKYEVYKDSALLSSITDLSTFTTVSGLVLGTAYQFDIKAVNIVGSSEATTLLVKFANVPSKPQNVNIKVAINNVVIRWEAPADTNGDTNIGYKIYLSNNIDPSIMNSYVLTYDTGCQSGIFTYTFDSSSFILNKSYYVSITAYNVAGESEEVFNSFTYGSAPSEPYGLSVKDMVPNSSITISFKVPTETYNAPIIKYVLNKDGVDSSVLYTVNEIVDDITGKNIGDVIIYKIKAVNMIGESNYSLSMKVTVASIPNPPSNLRISSRVSKSAINIVWDVEAAIANNAPTLGYVIYIKNIDDNINDIIDTTISTIHNTYSITDLIPSRQYQITVRAINTVGESTDSNSLSLIAGTVPSKVLNIKRDISRTTTSSIYVIFSPPSDDGGNTITKYNIYYDLTNTGTTFTKYVLSTSSITSDMSYEFTSLTKGQKVMIKISAENSIGEGIISDKYIFVASTKPNAPQNFAVSSINIASTNTVLRTLSASSGSFANVIITWDAPSDDGGSDLLNYKLYIDNNEAGSISGFVAVDTDISAWNTQYEIDNLDVGRTYSLLLVASNINGDSDALTASMTTATVSSHPYDLKISSSAVSSINIEWTKPETENGAVITSYKIYYQDITDSSQPLQNVLTNSIVTIHSLTGLTADHQYKLYVTAINDIGESRNSNTVLSYASSVPSGLAAPTVVSHSLNSISIAWTAPTASTLSVTGYDVLIDNGEDNTPYITVYSGKYINNVLSFEIKNLTPGNYYNIAIIAYNAAGASDLSPTLRELCGALPKPPNKIKAVSISSTSITISWNAPDDTGGIDLTNYVIYITSPTASSATVDHSVTSYTLSTVTVGTTYVFELTSKNLIGESAHSSSLSVTAVDLPSPPTLTLTASNSDKCILSWNAVAPPASSSIINYILYTDNALTSTAIPNVVIYTGLATTFTHTGLTINTIYNYAIVSVNEAGTSVLSTSISCRTIPIANAPSGISLVESSATHIKVQWTPPLIAYSEIVSYKLYMQESGSINNAYTTSWSIIYEGSDLVFDVMSGLTAKKMYDFKVSDVDVEGRESATTNIVSYYAASVPNQVTNLDAENYSINEIKLTWTKPTIGTNDLDVNQYIIYIRNYNNEYKEQIVLSNARDIESYIINSNSLNNQMTIGETYYISMGAVNEVGNSILSSEVNIILQHYPSPPDEVKISLISPTSSTLADLTLKWNTPSDNGGVSITGYSITSTDLSDPSPTPNEIYTATSDPKTTTILTGLTIGHKYKFIIYSYNPLKSLTASSPIEVIIGVPPDVVTSVTVGDRSRTSIEISWTAPADNGNAITQYNIYNMNNDQRILIYTGSETSFSLEGLTQGDIINVIITAINAIGESDDSSIFKYSIYGLPDPPVNIAIKSFTKSNIVITWSPSMNNGGDLITNYKIYRQIANDPNNIKTNIATVSSSTMIYDDSTVQAGEAYTYTLTSVNTLGEGDYSMSISAKAISAPTGMSSITPTLIDISSTEILVSWSSVTDNGGSNSITYSLYYRSNLSNDEFKLAYSGYNTAFKVTSLTPGVYYLFKVVASNEIGSDSSLTTSLHLCGDVPSAPTNLIMVYRKDTAMSGAGSSSIMISWSAPSPISIPLIGYNVYVSTDGSTFTQDTAAFSKNNPTIRTYTLSTGVTCGNYYYFVVTAVNAIGESRYSNKLVVLAGEIPIKPNLALGLSASAMSKSIKITVPTYTTPNSISGSTPITRYVIMMDNGKSGIINTVINDSINTIVNIDGLEVGATYRFRYAISNLVYDWNNLNNEDLVYSDEYSIIVASTPLQVKNFRIGSTDYTDKILLLWDKADNDIDIGSPVTNYIITQKDTSGSTTYTASSISTSYFVTGLTPGVSYEFTIKARNAIGDGVESYSLNVLLGTVPTQMQRPTISSSTSTSVKLSWTLPTGVESGGTIANPLTIKYFTLYANKNIIYVTGDNTELFYEISNLILGESYNFQITCTNDIGESPLSIMTTFIPSTYPSKPLDVSTEYMSHNSVLIKWESPISNGGLPVTEYELIITKVDDSTELTFSHIKAEMFGFTTTNGMVSGKEYTVKVRAHNSFSESNSFNNPNWSASYTFYSSDLPKKVENLNIRNVNKYTAELYWTKLTTVEDKGYSTVDVLYSLEMKKGDNKDFFVVFEGDSDKFVFTIPDRAIVYQFRLRTKNNIGFSGYSNTLVTYAAFNIANVDG